MRSILSFVVLVLLLPLGACIHDFEEGADISFRTVQARMTDNPWLVQGIWINGIDSSGMPPYAQLIGNWEISPKRDLTNNENYILYSALNGVVGYYGLNVGYWKLTNSNESVWFNFENYHATTQSTFGSIDVKFTEYKLICCRHRRLVLESTNKEYRPNQKVRLLLLPK